MNETVKYKAWDLDKNEMFTPYMLTFQKEKGLVVKKPKSKWSGLVVVPNCKLLQFSGFKDLDGLSIYEDHVVYLAGYGEYIVEFPFIELYEAAAEGDIGRILGNIHASPNLIKEVKKQRHGREHD